MRWLKILTIIFVINLMVISLVLVFLAQKDVPNQITYGMSFNVMYAKELGLDWKETYDAILNDLNVRYLRLAAHWPMIEPKNNEFNFEEMDYQLSRANEVGAKVVFAVGRRLPRWPECHNPNWTNNLNIVERNAEQLSYMTEVIERYKNNPAIEYWQIENEPFLSVFAFDHCGELDEVFLQKEIELVKTLDPSRSVLVTDSGNLGTWIGAYNAGDMFGTSVYVYFWNPELGQFKTLLPPFVYRIKENLLALIYGKKSTFLIELSAEPWLVAPVTEVPLDVQFGRMNVDKFEDILNYAEDTRYERQYLWGAEWWYWLHKQGHDEMWNKGRTLYGVE